MNKFIDEKVLFITLCLTISYYYFTTENDIILKKKILK